MCWPVAASCMDLRCTMFRRQIRMAGKLGSHDFATQCGFLGEQTRLYTVSTEIPGELVEICECDLSLHCSLIALSASKGNSCWQSAPGSGLVWFRWTGIRHHAQLSSRWSTKISTRRGRIGRRIITIAVWTTYTRLDANT